MVELKTNTDDISRLKHSDDFIFLKSYAQTWQLHNKTTAKEHANSTPNACGRNSLSTDNAADGHTPRSRLEPEEVSKKTKTLELLDGTITTITDRLHDTIPNYNSSNRELLQSEFDFSKKSIDEREEGTLMLEACEGKIVKIDILYKGMQAWLKNFRDYDILLCFIKDLEINNPKTFQNLPDENHFESKYEETGNDKKIRKLRTYPNAGIIVYSTIQTDEDFIEEAGFDFDEAIKNQNAEKTKIEQDKLDVDKGITKGLNSSQGRLFNGSWQKKWFLCCY